MERKVRVRFAPSPTGGMHLGGVRTVLYNYLFAKKYGGEFILRIEDTDQSRFVPGAEKYIFDTLNWCGLIPDESVQNPGKVGPYRQSERKDIYRKFALELVQKGVAYYAFDTAEELDQMRLNHKTELNPNPQYDYTVRMKMRTSLSMSPEEVEELLTAQKPYVIRVKMPENEKIAFTDLIRGEVIFDTSLSDDKVLLKADGMPTYHLAVVVDDYLMQITHAFRGEEWLPSAPVHIYLWKQLFGLDKMPQWAHLPLILGPSGKLSKRDGIKYGFPVFPISWTDPKTNETIEGFMERGFLPEAFNNMLAMLGWNDGSEQEIFTMDELIQRFEIEKVHKAGARFDYEKAKWFNHEWIKKLPIATYLEQLKDIFNLKGLKIQDEHFFLKVVELIKNRCTLLDDFYEHGSFFFHPVNTYDVASVQTKWEIKKEEFFRTLIHSLATINNWNSSTIESFFKQEAEHAGIKAGDLQLPLRIMLVGGKFGPPVFNIMEVLGKEETLERIEKALEHFKSLMTAS